MNKDFRNSKKTVGCGDFTDKRTQDYQLPKHFKEQGLSENGQVYLDISFKNGIRIEKTLFESGKNGVTDEWLMELDTLDGKMIGNEIQEERLADFSFGNVRDECVDIFIYQHSDCENKTVHELAFPEKKLLSPLEQVVHDVVEQCSERQKFVYDLRCNRQKITPFPVIAELYTEHFGTPTSEDGVAKLYHKVELKVCKALGVQYPSKHKER